MDLAQHGISGLDTFLVTNIWLLNISIDLMLVRMLSAKCSIGLFICQFGLGVHHLYRSLWDSCIER